MLESQSKYWLTISKGRERLEKMKQNSEISHCPENDFTLNSRIATGFPLKVVVLGRFEGERMLKLEI